MDDELDPLAATYDGPTFIEVFRMLNKQNYHAFRTTFIEWVKKYPKFYNYKNGMIACFKK